jgi:hypothetical protein
MTAPAEGPHWIDAKKAAGVPARYVTLRLDALFDRPLIGFDELEVPPWRRFRWGVRASGTRLPSALADALEPWWAERAAAAAPRAARRSASKRVR